VAGFCEHGNEPLGSTKGGKFLEILVTTKLKEQSGSINAIFL
jgi:hypothetical protein